MRLYLEYYHYGTQHVKQLLKENYREQLDELKNEINYSGPQTMNYFIERMEDFQTRLLLGENESLKFPFRRNDNINYVQKLSIASIIAFIRLFKCNSKRSPNFFIGIVLPEFDNLYLQQIAHYNTLSKLIYMFNVLFVKHFVISPCTDSHSHSSIYHWFYLQKDNKYDCDSFPLGSTKMYYEYFHEFVPHELCNEFFIPLVEKIKFISRHGNICEIDGENYSEKYHHSKFYKQNCLIISLRCYQDKMKVIRLSTQHKIQEPIDRLQALTNPEKNGLCQYFDESNQNKALEVESHKKLEQYNISDLYEFNELNELNKKCKWNFIKNRSLD